MENEYSYNGGRNGNSSQQSI